MENLTFAPLSTKVVDELHTLREKTARIGQRPTSAAAKMAALLKAHVSTNPWGHTDA